MDWEILQIKKLCELMIRIEITAEAFSAVASTLPLGTVAYDAEVTVLAGGSSGSTGTHAANWTGCVVPVKTTKG